MANELILFLEILIVFSLLLLAKKLFGKTGVMAWVCIASVLANLITAKNATIFGLSTAIGSVMFASTFLATDILTECYSAKEARKAVYMGICSTLMFIMASQIALFYHPSEIDYANKAMQTLFGMNLRISISSIVMFAIANLADVYLFDKIRQKTDGKMLWLRNNVATIICNCLENFFFIGFAFGGIYDFQTIITISLSTSAIETIIGICDTPFIYAARKIKEVNYAEGRKSIAD